MEPQQKKRKLESKSTPKPYTLQSPDPLEGIDARTMLDLICTDKHTRNNAFQTFLASLESATPEQARIVSSLLRPFLLSFAEPLHCVRCHKDYVEAENSNEACEIKHMGTEEVDDEDDEDDEDYGVRRVPYGMGIQKMRYICCDEEFEYGEEDKNEICCTERHTTNTDEVEYTLEGEFEDNWVVTCEESGCVTDSESETETETDSEYEGEGE
ncbi:hypothetical protein BDV93DRAFT_72764 [Ceratobasidium sp. AG-I]|nr:hypothetical protein BDV93DRAFT_72764 [Ceratobasidium sp. AG-I]